MSVVRFASTCDHPGCGVRSEEYTEWPECRDCGNHCCPQHATAMQDHSRDVEGTGQNEGMGMHAIEWVDCLCFACAGYAAREELLRFQTMPAETIREEYEASGPAELRTISPLDWLLAKLEELQADVARYAPSEGSK